nr:uncharacterized protein LOC129447284 [Misgurnus anguillicaudatus]
MQMSAANHISVRKGTELPPIRKCTECCSRYHCPLCNSNIFKPTDRYRVIIHLKAHLARSVKYKGYCIYKCNLGCKPQAHFHCVCECFFFHKNRLINHLSKSHCIPPGKELQTLLPGYTLTGLTTKEAETSLTDDDDGTAPTRKEAETSLTKGEVRKPLTGEKDGTAPLLSIKTRRRQTAICPECNMCMNKKNMFKHILRKHSGVHTLDVTSNSHLPSQCLDHLNGIFAVVKTMHRSSVPLHVKKIWGDTQQVYCESPQCQSNHDLAVSFQCSHVRAVDYCSSTAESELLKEDVLSEMVAKKWFGGDRKAECLKLQSLATSQSVPLSVETTVGVPTFKHYVSVFEPNVSYLRRVMVVYNARRNSWHCPCIQSRRSCPHKYIAKWHLFQKYPELFRSKKSTETCIEVDQSTPDNDDDLPDGGTHYPPNGTMLKNMVTYIYEQKKIPAILPRELCCQVHDDAFPKLLVPDEMFCTFCHDITPLSDPILITSKAKIVTMNGVVEDVSTFCKMCIKCGAMYRYQEFKDQLHNFNDHILISLNLCLFLRSSLQAHSAVSRVIDSLENLNDVKYPSSDTCLHAYLHFEALCDNTYNFSCASCGDHPPVVIMDLHKKGDFSMAASDIEDTPKDFKGMVNIEAFWNTVSLEMIGRGFVSSDNQNPFKVLPSYHFWAPWIGHKTRSSNVVLNTEFEKIKAAKVSEESQVYHVTEDRLMEELMNQKVDVVRKLCNECGLDTVGSKLDLILRLRSEMQTKHSYDKIFQKIWGASGGWCAIMCPCGVVYSLKFLIRAESPRDFADLLLSWKHLPNICIYDFARGLVAHTNVTRAPDIVPFQPFEGRLLEPTTENISMAREGKILCHLPWLSEKKETPDENGHPVTGSADHFVLYNTFHESNTKDPRDILRKVSLVPELAGKINSQVVEQFFSQMRENDYFLNNAAPATNIFLLRSIVHHRNQRTNNEFIKRARKTFVTDTEFNDYGQ